MNYIERLSFFFLEIDDFQMNNNRNPNLNQSHSRGQPLPDSLTGNF